MKFIALFALAALLPAQQDRFGLPACSDPDLELAHRSLLTLCHGASRKVPMWVAYQLELGKTALHCPAPISVPSRP
jgi:hypothetical protein